MPGVVDVDSLKEEFEDELEILEEIIQVFLDTYGEKVQKIDDGFRDNDLSQVEFFSHNLKGAVSNFHANGLVAIMKDLEFAAKDSNGNVAQEKWAMAKPQMMECIESLKTQLDSLKN